MKDKTKANKSKKSIINATSRVKKLTPKRNATVNRANADNGIGMSKQLQLKLQNSKRSGKTMPKRSTSKNSEEPRICGNGKPMPSLIELEQMFDDSDSDDEPQKNSTVTNTVPPTETPTCSTPKPIPQISEDKLKSPNTIKSIADKMLDYISNLPDPIEILDNDGPPLPVVPPKKRKKPDVPYVVGCKDRPQVPGPSSVNFCKGDDYGIDRSGQTDDDDEIQKPRAKRSKVVNVSKSLFNAKSDEIAIHLKNIPDTVSEEITNFTHYLTPTNTDRSRSFSPIPSTSRDSDVIHKNDVLFNESLQGEHPNDEENTIEIINPSYETITIDDSLQTIKSPVVENGTVIEIDVDSNSNQNHNLKDNKDDTCEIIESNSTVRSKVESPIIVEDYYSSLDLNQPCNIDLNEVIDVDDVIAESNAIIEKYRSKKQLETVTSVQPSFNIPENSINTRSEPSEQCKEEYSNKECNNNIKNNSIINVEDLLDNSNNIRIDQSENRSLTTESIADREHNSVIDLDDTVQQNNNQHDTVPTINIEDEVSDENQNVSRFNSESYTRNRSDNVSSTSVNNRNQNTGPNTPTITTISQSVLQEITDFIENDDDRELCLEVFYHNIMNVFKQGQVYIIKDKKSSESRATTSKTPSSQFQHPSRRRRLQQTSVRQNQSRISAQELRKRISAQQAPVTVVHQPKRSSEQEPQTQPSKGLGDCPICMDNLSNNSIASTVCGHVFCMKCIKAAVKTSGRRCPTCRKGLKGNGYHQLFL